MKRLLKYALWAFLLLFAFMIGAASERASKKDDASTANLSCEPRSSANLLPAAPAAPPPVADRSVPDPPARPAPQMPAAEKAFIQAVERARSRYASGANEMQKGAARPRRAKEICEALKSAAVKNWIGHVEQLSTNGDGKGVLKIRIADNLFLMTSNNALSDLAWDTLIDPDSTLFHNASALSDGQLVSFSGSFIRSKEDCVQEVSLTLHGSIQEPAFIIRFSDVSGL